METFKIEIKEMLSKIVEVKASSVDEAISLVEKLYKSEDAFLSAQQHISTDIDISNLETLGSDVEFSNFILRKAEEMISNLSIEELSKIGFGNYSIALNQYKMSQ